MVRTGSLLDAHIAREIRTLLFWAGDLRYTPEGYRLIAEQITAAFHDSSVIWPSTENK